MGVLNDEQIAGALDALPGWERDGDALACDVECGDFKDAIGFVNRVADLAEARTIIPTSSSTATSRAPATLSTHSEGGITENDVALARAIDAL